MHVTELPGLKSNPTPNVLVLVDLVEPLKTFDQK